MKKTMITIAVSQIMFAIQLLLVKYAVIGFMNIETTGLLRDILIMLISTVGITAISVFVYSGVWMFIQDLKMNMKKKTTKQKGTKES